MHLFIISETVTKIPMTLLYL